MTVYTKVGEWHVDSPTSENAFTGSLNKGASTVGTIGQKSNFNVMYDNPQVNELDCADWVSFEARTYLVSDSNKIVYSIA